MPKLVLSTAKIVMDKVFNNDIDVSWKDWAIEMLEAGFDSQSLYVLASISTPFNQFQLHDLTNRVLSELDIDYKDRNIAVKNYVFFLLNKSVNKPECYMDVLQELKDLCIRLGHKKEYMDFYLLYFAKADLIDAEIQWYWDGANRKNIDNMITEYFNNWLIDYYPEKSNPRL